MRAIRRFGSAIVASALVAGMLVVSPVGLEAKKRGGTDPQAAICAYLDAVITYPYVDPYVKAYALALWNYYGCTT